MTDPAVAISDENVPVTDWPLTVALNVAGVGPDPTSRKPVPPLAVDAVAGRALSMFAGTVKLPAPAVVVQMNSVAVTVGLVLLPDVDPE